MCIHRLNKWKVDNSSVNRLIIAAEEIAIDVHTPELCVHTQRQYYLPLCVYTQSELVRLVYDMVTVILVAEESPNEVFDPSICKSCVNTEWIAAEKSASHSEVRDLDSVCMQKVNAYYFFAYTHRVNK